MTMVVSIFGFAGRIAGDLLTSALGWASSLLFGRVPRSHQIFLIVMMAGSFLWIVLVLGLLVPSIAALLLSATPHPPFVNQAWLGFALLVGVIFLPLGVGLAGYLVPAEGERPGGAAVVRDVLRGYLLAPLISGLLIFLASVGIVRKIRSRRHGWSDIHVPIVVKPGGYDRMVVDLQEALESADLPAAAEDAPWVLTLPARLLTVVAGGNVRKLRPDRLIELRRPDLRIGVYPSDIAISGDTRERTRARAAILSRLATTSARMTVSAEAQEVEDRLGDLASPAGPSGPLPRAAARAAFKAIDARLLELAVPTDEWDILYRLRLQIERDLLTGAEPGTAFPGHEPDPADVAASVGPAGRALGSTAPRLGATAALAVMATPRSMPTSSRDVTVGHGDRR
jgi:hypothetical protein